MQGKYLITTDNWFIAPDGKQYRAVWGEAEVLSDSFLGVKTNEKSTNWFVKIGKEGKAAIIAGCQIHYAVQCPNKPQTGEVWEYSIVEGVTKEYTAPSKIYNAE